jgi:hypothetical protein
MSLASFAKLDENNMVTDIFIVDQSDVDNNGGDNSTESENWIKTNILKNESVTIKQFYVDESFRVNSAEIGGYYNSDNDVFIKKQPYPSWSLGNDFKWTAPIAYPTVLQDPDLLEWSYSPSWDEEEQVWRAAGPNSEKLKWNTSTYSWNIVD